MIIVCREVVPLSRGGEPPASCFAARAAAHCVTHSEGFVECVMGQDSYRGRVLGRRRVYGWAASR